MVPILGAMHLGLTMHPTKGSRHQEVAHKGLHHSNTNRTRGPDGHILTHQTSVGHKHLSSLALIRPAVCLHQLLTFTRLLAHSNRTANNPSSNLYDRYRHKLNRLTSPVLGNSLVAMLQLRTTPPTQMLRHP